MRRRHGRERYAPLTYRGERFPGYTICSDGNLYTRNGRRGPMTKHVRSDRSCFRVKRTSGKWRWIYAHVAVHESFRGVTPPNKLWRHKAHTRSTDCYLGSCELGTPKQNSKDRRRDGTHHTRNTTPGKLKPYRSKILALVRQGLSDGTIAKKYECTRRAIGILRNTHG
jgi:hypothetical protein